MYTLRFCVYLWADGCDFINLMMSKNCVICVLPGYSMSYIFWTKIYYWRWLHYVNCQSHWETYFFNGICTFWPAQYTQLHKLFNLNVAYYFSQLLFNSLFFSFQPVHCVNRTEHSIADHLGGSTSCWAQTQGLAWRGPLVTNGPSDCKWIFPD